jgi:hypothetical protein
MLMINRETSVREPLAGFGRNFEALDRAGTGA